VKLDTFSPSVVTQAGLVWLWRLVIHPLKLQTLKAAIYFRQCYSGAVDNRLRLVKDTLDSTK